VRPLLKESARTIMIERGADFGSGRNKDHACIGENARFIGFGTIIIGRHVMMGPDVMIITSDHKPLPRSIIEAQGSKSFNGWIFDRRCDDRRLCLDLCSDYNS